MSTGAGTRRSVDHRLFGQPEPRRGSHPSEN